LSLLGGYRGVSVQQVRGRWMAVVAKLGTDGELGMRLLGRMQVPGQQPATGYSRCRIEVEGSMYHGQLERVLFC
jgi:hypothetical protein